jgi:hypothetical protein
VKEERLQLLYSLQKSHHQRKLMEKVILEEAMGQTFLNRMRDDLNRRMQYMAELRIENKTKHQR